MGFINIQQMIPIIIIGIILLYIITKKNKKDRKKISDLGAEVYKEGRMFKKKIAEVNDEFKETGKNIDVTKSIKAQ